MSGTAGRATEQLRSDRNVGGRDAGARSAGAHPLGQWTRVRGAEAAAVAVEVGAKTLYIEPGSPWENGYCESFNGKLRDECLNGEIFYSLKEAQVVIEQ